MILIVGGENIPRVIFHQTMYVIDKPMRLVRGLYLLLYEIRDT